MLCVEESDNDADSAAVLTAALQYVDSWEDATSGVAPASGHVAMLPAQSSSSSSSGGFLQASRTNQGDDTDKKAPATGKATRRRQPLDELRELRREEFELSTNLNALRLEARRRLASPIHTALGDRPAGFWQRAATRQFEYRKCAEGENERLRVLVQAHIRKAKYLRQVLLKRAKVEVPSSLVDKGAPSAPPLADNDSVFAKLLATIDGDYLAAIQALHAKKTQSGVSPRHRTSSVGMSDARHGDDDVWLDYFADTDMPFSPHAVEKAMWHAFTQQSSRRNPSFRREFVQVSGDLIKSCAHLEIHTCAFHLLVQARIVARKYLERGRTVVVLKSLVEPRWAKDGALIGMLCHETTVRVLTPSDSTHAATRVETYATLRGEVREGLNAGFWRRDLTLSIAKMVWGRAQLARNEMVESLLVDASLQGSTATAPNVL